MRKQTVEAAYHIGHHAARRAALLPLPAKRENLGQIGHRYRQVDANADAHQEAGANQHPDVRRQPGGDSRNHEKEHIGHKTE